MDPLPLSNPGGMSVACRTGVRPKGPGWVV